MKAVTAALLSDEIEVNVGSLFLVPIPGFHVAIEAAQKGDSAVIEQTAFVCDIPFGPELKVGENITRIAPASDVFVLRTGTNVVVVVHSPHRDGPKKEPKCQKTGKNSRSSR